MKNGKKYIKIISSCAIVLCMMCIVLFHAKDAEATDKEIIYAPGYVYTTSKYVVDGEKVAPAAPANTSGYLFAGWYTLPDDSTTYTSVKEPKENEEYYAKFVPQEVLGIKAQVTTALIKDKATSGQADSAIRFVTTVDSNLYKEVGFNIERPGKDAPYDTGNGVLYVELYAVDATRENKGDADTTITPDMFHAESEFFKTWTIGKIPDTYYDSDITVRPYWITLDGTRVDGKEAIKTVNLGRSWIYVDSTYDGEERGTLSKPYSGIETAIGHDTTLAPKLILKSDVTVAAAVEVTKTMTMEGFDGDETITCAIDTTNPNTMIDVAKNANLTLNKLNLNGGYYVVKSSGGSVTANHVNIQDGERYGFYIDGGTASLNDINIQQVERGIQLLNQATVTGDTLSVANPKQGVLCGGGSTFDYNNLTIDGNTENAINVYGDSTVIVDGGEILNAKAHGMNVAGANATLKGVNVTFATGATSGYGIYAIDENGVKPKVTLENVGIKGAPGRGIYMEDGAEGTSMILKDVEIDHTGNTTRECLYVTHSSSVIVDGALTTKGGSFGIALYKASRIEKGDHYSMISISSPKDDGVRVMDSETVLSVGEMMISGGSADGIQLEVGTIELDGTLSISQVADRGIRLVSGTLSAENATIKIDSAGTYGLSTVIGGTIDKLEITNAGAKTGTGFSAALQIGNSASLTINSITIKDSYRYGINMNSTGSLTIHSGTITNSGRGTAGYVDIRKENSNATMNIGEDVDYATSNGWDK